MRTRQITPDDRVASEVETMVDSHFGYYGGPYWKWKYADPAGAPAVIIAAENDDGDLIGCHHYLALQYHIGANRDLSGLVAGDLLVGPDQRRQRIGSDLTYQGRVISSKAHPESLFVTMFTWRALGDHLQRLLGYTKLRPGFREWSKRITWSPQLTKLADMNESLLAQNPRLAKVDHGFRLDIAGSRPVELNIGPGGVNPGRNNGRPAFAVKVSDFESIQGGGKTLPLKVIWGLVSGRIRIRGSLKAMTEALLVTGVYAAIAKALRSG